MLFICFILSKLTLIQKINKINQILKKKLFLSEAKIEAKNFYRGQIWGQANFWGQAKIWFEAKLEAKIEARPT